MSCAFRSVLSHCNVNIIPTYTCTATQMIVMPYYYTRVNGPSYYNIAPLNVALQYRRSPITAVIVLMITLTMHDFSEKATHYVIGNAQ